MTVFKTFLKVLKKNRGIVIMYTAILLGFGCINMQANTTSTTFEAKRPDIIIVNNDKEEGVTKGLIEYLKENSDIPDVENTEEAINDAIFYEEANLVVYIPENFNQDFLSGKKPEIKVKKGTSYYASFAEMMLTRYLKVANVYQEDIKDVNELVAKISETLKDETKTELTSKLDTTGLSRAATYYNFANYSFLACLIYIICLTLSSFNEDNVKKRTIISSCNYKKHNRILLLSNMMYSLVLWAFYVIVSFIIIGDVMQSVHGVAMIINSLIFVICSTALSFLIGSIVKNKDAIGGIVNVVGLGSSFLCGAFVPAEWLPDTVKNIAHILPSYYYINSNDIISGLEEVNMDTLMPVFVNAGIMLGFTAVFVILANLVTKKKRKIG